MYGILWAMAIATMAVVWLLLSTASFAYGCVSWSERKRQIRVKKTLQLIRTRKAGLVYQATGRGWIRNISDLWK